MADRQELSVASCKTATVQKPWGENSNMKDYVFMISKLLSSKLQHIPQRKRQPTV